MGFREEDLEARLMPGRIPFVSLAVVATTTALLWALSLPTVPTHAPDIQHVTTVFHPEWIVLATLLAGPLKRLAAWRCWVGLLGLFLAGVLSFAITDEAVDRVRAAGIDLGGTESAWIALAAFQVMLFAVATGQGLRQRMFTWRWQRLSRKIAAGDPQPTERAKTL
jgi:hypothetical protein